MQFVDWREERKGFIRFVKGASEASADISRVGIGVLFVVQECWTGYGTLLALLLLNLRRPTRLAAGEIAGGVFLGICFHARAGSVVGFILVVLGASLGHAGNLREPSEVESGLSCGFSPSRTGSFGDAGKNESGWSPPPPSANEFSIPIVDNPTKTAVLAESPDGQPTPDDCRPKPGPGSLAFL